jgi:diguanylate cyclase (GGDEF)-like protein
MVAGITLFFVTPFAMFRLFQGYYSVALVEIAVIVVSIATAAYAWLTGSTKTAGIVIAVLLPLADVSLSLFVGLDAALWIFPITLFVFYLAPPPLALTLILVALLGFAGQQLLLDRELFGTPNQMASFLVSGVAAAIFSYLFAVRSSVQRKQLIRLATIDPLTDLYNRRALDDELKSALSARDRYQRSYGMIVLDLDRFKELNDQLGHAEGDRVLREFADMISKSIRKSDRAFRYGGDEFVVLLPDADRHGLRRVAESIVENVRTSVNSSVTVEASAGAALLREEDDHDSWNRRADRCLYAAKEAGRNQVVLDGDPR